MEKKYSSKPLRQQFFMEMVEKHGDCCMICGKHVRHLVIDHDHRTGIMRGILCMAHNSGIGMFDDDPELMEQAAKYLRELKPVFQPHQEKYGQRVPPVELDAIHDIIKQEYSSDRARARALINLYGGSECMWQTRISRVRHAASRASKSLGNLD